MEHVLDLELPDEELPAEIQEEEVEIVPVILSLSTYHEKNFTKISLDFHQYPGFISALNTERLLLRYLSQIQSFLHHQYHWAYILAIIYLLFIVILLPKWLQRRRSYRFGDILTIWYLFMAMFSFLGTLRTVPELLYMVDRFGWIQSICDDRFIDDPRYFLWVCLFKISKILELFDTIFLILMKQPLQPEHYIKRIGYLCYIWSLLDLPGTYRWMASLSFLINTIQYGYLALENNKPNGRMPKSLTMIITILQLDYWSIMIMVEAITMLYPHNNNNDEGDNNNKSKWLPIIGFFIDFILFLLMTIGFFRRKQESIIEKPEKSISRPQQFSTVESLEKKKKQ